MNTTDFVARARVTHGSRFDYDATVWQGANVKVLVRCVAHNLTYSIIPRKHLSGPGGCTKCAAASTRTALGSSTESFIASSRKVHGERYSYERTRYVRRADKVTITCPTHGDFEQLANNHLQGAGCPLCYQENAAAFSQRGYLRLQQEAAASFTQKATEVHSGRYSYERTVYGNSRTPVVITCPLHGDFEQAPFSHLLGAGCPRCGGVASKGEEQIAEALSERGLKVERRVRSLVAGYEADIWLPEKRVAVEYHGLYWHSDRFKDNNYHVEKLKAFQAADIRLIQVFEDEWRATPEIVLSALVQKLGVTQRREYARQCGVRLVPPKVAREFLASNHLQGPDVHSVAYGAFLDDELLAVMTFGKPSLSGGAAQCEWSLGRFAVLRNCAVVGGFSRLYKRFLVDYRPTSIQTFADLRWSEGDVYLKHGFELTHNTAPNYWYYDGKQARRHHRFSFRKSLLAKRLLNYDPALTERENMANHGWLRVYDAGNAVFRRNFFV